MAMLGTLIRAGDVLDLFTVEEPEWGVTATAQRLGIGKSLAHEALATLTEIGLLRRVGHGRYRLGWRNVSLAAMLLRTNGLSAHAGPILRELATAQGLAVGLLAWERGQVICISRHQGRSGPAGQLPVAGTTMAPDDSAGARVLLAARSPAEVRGLWNAGSIRTRHATLEQLSADLAEIRRVGWGRDAEDSGPSMTVAAPVRDEDGAVAAAISLAGSAPVSPLDVYRRARLAVHAAARLSESLRETPAAVQCDAV